MTLVPLSALLIAGSSSGIGAASTSPGARCGEQYLGAELSPSGRWAVVYQRPAPKARLCSQTALWLLGTRSTDRRLLTRKLEYFSWAPHHDRLAFTTADSDNAPPYALLITKADRKPRRLVAASRLFPFFQWSPDGRSLAFERGGKLQILASAGSRPRAIAPATGWIDWSPNGKRLVFQARQPALNSETMPEIRVVDRRGSRVTSIARGLFPSWSADGNWISFYPRVAFRLGEIAVVRPDGSGERSVLSGCFVSRQWEPHGTRLALGSDSCSVSTNPKVQIVNPETAAVLMTDTGSLFWSPAGGRLALRRYEESARLTLVEPDGQNRVDLVQAPTDIRDVAWSPTGRRLAFEAADPGAAPQIFISDAAGSHVRLVVAGRGPVWSPSGEELAFLRTRPGCGDELWLVRLRTRAVRRLVPCKGRR